MHGLKSPRPAQWRAICVFNCNRKQWRHLIAQGPQTQSWCPAVWHHRNLHKRRIEDRWRDNGIIINGKPIHTLTPFTQERDDSDGCISLPATAAAPRRCAPAPKRGARFVAAGPRSRIHRNGPFCKPARKRPRAFGGDGHAPICLSTGLGGVCHRQSRPGS